MQFVRGKKVVPLALWWILTLFLSNISQVSKYAEFSFNISSCASPLYTCKCFTQGGGQWAYTFGHLTVDHSQQVGIWQTEWFRVLGNRLWPNLRSQVISYVKHIPLWRFWQIANVQGWGFRHWKRSTSNSPSSTHRPLHGQNMDGCISVYLNFSIWTV